MSILVRKTSVQTCCCLWGLLICLTSLSAEDVTVRDGKAKQDGKTLETGKPIFEPPDSGFDLFDFDVFDAALMLAKKTFNAPNEKGKQYTFTEFEKLDPKQAPTNKLIDLILANMTLDAKGFSENGLKIVVPLKFTNFKDAGGFPLMADGNLKRPKGPVGAGKKAQTPKKKVPPELLWAAKVRPYDLDVDADRDGTVHILKDDSDEDKWTKDRGAIIIVNYDDDDSLKNPDAIDFDDFGEPKAEDLKIEKGDLPDIASLVVQPVGPKKDLQFFLRIDKDGGKAVHIFEERKENAKVLGGGWDANKAAKDPVVFEITSQVKENAAVDLGIEGLFYPGFHSLAEKFIFSGKVDIELVVQRTKGVKTIVPDKVIATDKVRVQVAPYLMLPYTFDATEAWLTTMAGGNDVAAKFGGAARRAAARGIFLQDHAQVGFTQMPTQKTFSSMLTASNKDETWMRTDQGGKVPLLRAGANKGRGIFRFRNTRQPGRHIPGTYPGPGDRLGRLLYARGDFGGGIELIPPTKQWPLGRILIGNTGTDFYKEFFKAQKTVGVEALQEPIEIDCEWLFVGHVDEMVGILPTGGANYKVVLPGIDQALNILRAKTTPGHTPVFSTGQFKNGTASNHFATREKKYLFDGVASGLIKVVGKAGLKDKETFTLSDGAITKTFEFDDDGALTDKKHIKIDLNVVTTPENVRDEVKKVIDRAGFTLNTDTDGNDAVIIWQKNFGAGKKNTLIAETVDNAGFVVKGMAGGEATGTDFSDADGVSFKYVRIYNGTNSGTVGMIHHRGKGYCTIRLLYRTSSRSVPDANPAVMDLHAVWSYAAAKHFASAGLGPTFGRDVPVQRNWPVDPRANSKFVIVQDSKHWHGRLMGRVVQFPAVITAFELKNDANLRRLNTIAKAKIADAKTKINKGMGAGGVKFVYTPSLFFGRYDSANGGSVKVAEAYPPGAVNFMPITPKRVVFPKPFGPLVGGKDLFEESIKTTIGAGNVEIVDEWEFYHLNVGEVHCSTVTVRPMKLKEWWRTLK